MQRATSYLRYLGLASWVSWGMGVVAMVALAVTACSSAGSSGGGMGGSGVRGTGGSVAAGVGGSTSGAGGVTVSGRGGSPGAGGATTVGGGGGSPGAGGSPGTGGAATALWKCPAGTFAPLASTAGLTPQRLAGAPPADNYAPGFSIVEGPVWLDGALYVSQIQGGTPPPPSRILKIVPGGATTVFASNDGTNGLAILPDGDLVGAIHIDGSVCRVPIASPDFLVPIAYVYLNERFNAPNDLAVRSDGNIYFSDPDANQAPTPHPQAKTRVYRISPLPIAAVTVVDDMLSEPNGVTLSLDENTLFVSGPGLYKYPVAADGSVGARQDAVTNPSMYTNSDGMVIDCAGDLYVANNQRIAVINPAGTEVGSIAVPGVQGVTNVAFGGADHRTLFITTLDANPGVFTVAMPLPGMPY
jgi:gluconolactonase